MTAANGTNTQISFIQSDVPPLRTGVYALTATETVPGQTPGTFAAEATFVVQGERFAIAAAELVSVFPPSLANGEFAGALPHVVFDRRTLPWERSLRNDDSTTAECPWLAVLLFDDVTAPTPAKVTAKDLVPAGTPITVVDSSVTSTGTLPATTLSYGAETLVPMGYGETPDDACLVIDVPVNTFSAIAPSVHDLLYLAHIRDVKTSDGVHPDTEVQSAVVVGNRIPATNVPCRAVLVSLENMADYLPADDGTPSTHIPSGTELVRLLAYTTWTFTANDLEQNLLDLLENLNTNPGGSPTTLRLPIVGDAPSAPRVQQAAANQAAAAAGTGTLTPADATVIVQNALAMGYVPLDHHLRHGGDTVSWYRGPLVPLPVASTIEVPVGGPDAANRYDPQAGLFDVSYGAAWQLGQLLALQNTGVANAIYAWRQSVLQAEAAVAEQELLRKLLGDQPVMDSLLSTREARLDADAYAVPPTVSHWVKQLVKLEGVPFNYLVADERILPPESLRFFYLDDNWLSALVDGALSIGRATSGETQHARHLLAVLDEMGGGQGGVTGFLFRSQAVSGWPNLRFNGYADVAMTSLLRRRHRVDLAQDTVLCLFEGVVEMLVIEEAPEQLHMGVEGDDGVYWTTLREVSLPTPGKQYTAVKPAPCNPGSTEAVACLDMRADGRTLRVSDAANAIRSILETDFAQTFPNGFTSAEFALEMNEGALVVEFENAESTEGRP